METYNDQKEKLAKKVSEAKKELNSIKSKVSAIKKKIAKEKNTQKKSALNVDEGNTYSGGTLATIEDAGSYTVTTSVDEYDNYYYIVGVYEYEKNGTMSTDTDEDVTTSAFIPYDTAKEQVHGDDGYSAAVPVGAIIVATLFSMIIGIFFGYYPANKAAKLNPIDALRYE